MCEELALLRGKSSSSAYRVFATARDVSSLEELRAKGLDTLQLDVCDNESVKACVDAVLKAAGRIDVVIANAGIIAVMPLLEQPLGQMTKVLDTNLLGVLRVIQVIPVRNAFWVVNMPLGG